MFLLCLLIVFFLMVLGVEFGGLILLRIFSIFDLRLGVVEFFGLIGVFLNIFFWIFLFLFWVFIYLLSDRMVGKIVFVLGNFGRIVFMVFGFFIIGFECVNDIFIWLVLFDLFCFNEGELLYLGLFGELLIWIFILKEVFCWVFFFILLIGNIDWVIIGMIFMVFLFWIFIMNFFLWVFLIIFLDIVLVLVRISILLRVCFLVLC